MKKICLLILLVVSQFAFSQENLSPLSVELIMRDPKWIGTSPSRPYWSADGKYLFFSWNPEKAISDSVYYISMEDREPKKTSHQFRQNHVAANNVDFNRTGTAFVFARNGDLFLRNKKGSETRITETIDIETEPQFNQDDTGIFFIRNQNVYSWEISTGKTTQLTNFQKGSAPKEDPPLNKQEEWLKRDQLRTSEVLRSRKEKREATEAATKAFREEPREKLIYLNDKDLNSVTISPDGRFVTYRLSKQPSDAKNTIVPNYVTETGFTTDLRARTKVGAPRTVSEFFIYDRQADTVIRLDTRQIPGIYDFPDYSAEPLKSDTSKNKKPRNVLVLSPLWNRTSSYAVVDIRSEDNKDRWLMLLDAANGKLTLVDRQRDEAWIGGPAIGWNSFPGQAANIWLDEKNFWYTSEESGYAHLYKADVTTGKKTRLTSGNFEVQSVHVNERGKFFYLITNEIHPGEKHLYRLSFSGGRPERITNMQGANDVIISPDEKRLAILHSYSNKPWELFIQDNKPGAKPQQVTFEAQSSEFRSYAWRDPEVVSFKAADGAEVFARLYRPSNPHPSKPAVIFVHGAGYLQNAHKWWSSYFREYMFHNLLADKGYTVLDIDYRGSAGYGRDWRTGIYRNMGGKDLSDQVDGAKYLVEKYGVNPSKIGIYGGSYGGFITLMAMFREADVFRSGAALRSVTDWAHYNDPYTSNILNEPYNDSLAFIRSSPIYYAEGLKGDLLMCHGMIDVNVHFQDIVRLTQRLIELGKDNWELAVYPLEDHGFVEPSSWTDEYKRILKLFERTLK